MWGRDEYNEAIIYAWIVGQANAAKQKVENGSPADEDTGETRKPPVNDDSHLSPAKLADLFQAPTDALRTRLNRWRKSNHHGWIENPDRAANQPKYLYRVGAVRPVIEALIATSETTSKRPAKKILQRKSFHSKQLQHAQRPAHDH